MSEVELVGSLKALAHFQHKKEESIEPLIKRTITLSDKLSLGALASIVDSLAELEMANPILMGITREVFLQRVDLKAQHLI